MSVILRNKMDISSLPANADPHEILRSYDIGENDAASAKVLNKIISCGAQSDLRIVMR